jgi:hypothetical protein
MNSNTESVETVTSIIDSDNGDLDLSLFFGNSDSTTIPISSVIDRDALIKLQQSDSCLKRHIEQARQSPHYIDKIESFSFKSGV